MSQRDRALEIVRRDVLPLAFGAEPGTPAATRLRVILAEAQNPPPDGEADGSIGEAEWTALRDVADALERLASLSSRLVSGAALPSRPASGALGRGPEEITENDVWRDAHVQWPNRWSAGE